MPESHLDALSQVEQAFRFHRQDLVEIFLEVRSIALNVKPTATERISSTGITLFDADKGGTITGGICFVDIRGGFVRLRFGRGALLSDPNSLLSGDQKYMRYMDLRSFEEAPWMDIESLIRESANLDESLGRVNTNEDFVVYCGYGTNTLSISTDRGLSSTSARQCEHLQSSSA